MKIALRASNGYFVTAESGGSNDGEIRANRPAPDPGPWETWIVVPQGGTKIALQSNGDPDSGRWGRFLSAEGGGGTDLHVNRALADDPDPDIPVPLRTAIGPWEQFTVEGDLVDGGIVNLRTDNGHYVCCEVASPDPILNASRAAAGSWESFQVEVIEADQVVTPPGVPGLTTRTGLVKGQGRLVVDDGGAFNPLGATFFPLFWGWKFARERTKQNVILFSGTADYLRVLCEVGGSSWADRVIDPSWPDYEDIVRDAIDWVYDVARLRLELTLIGGGTGHDPLDVARKVADAVAGREHKLIHWEGGNEATNGNLDDTDLALIGHFLAGAYPAMLRAASCGDPASTSAYIARGLANMGTFHPDRTNNTVDDGWRQVRQSWDWNGGPDVPGSQNEPAGPESSVATQDRAILIAMQRAVGILAGLACYVYHAGPGVRLGGQEDLKRGRHANFYDLPDFDSHLAALRAVGKLLPADLAEWAKYNGHWAGHPLPADCVWTDGYDHGVTRTYGAVRGDRFVTLPHGIKQWVRLYALRDCEVTVYSPLTGVMLRTMNLKGGAVHGVGNAGEEFHGDGDHVDLDGPERSGGLDAYIVLGRFI